MGFVQLDWSDWAFGVAIREWQAFNGWSIMRVCQVNNFLSGNSRFDFSFFLYTLYTLIHLCAHCHNRHYSFYTIYFKPFLVHFKIAQYENHGFIPVLTEVGMSKKQEVVQRVPRALQYTIRGSWFHASQSRFERSRNCSGNITLFPPF